MNERFSEVMAETYVARTCFKTGPPRAIGLELEWIVHHRGDPARPLSTTDLAAASAAGSELRAGRLTVEPGGQVELSSHPFADPAAGMRAIEQDVTALRTALARSGLELAGVGIDAWRPPQRLLDTPRYAAMEHHFDRGGPAGRAMMCTTAAVQVNLDAGPEADADSRLAPDAVDMPTRWALLHELVPLLVATFANSPLRAGRPSARRCGRADIWAAIDPSRTRAAYPGRSGDPRTDWVEYVLGANVLCIPSEGPDWSAPAGLTFRDWMRGGGPRPVGQADLDYHLTTLFPPVRPRGHFELRVIDAQRTTADAGAALALVWALCTDRAAADAARESLAVLAAGPALAERAARDAMADPELATTAKACFGAAIGSLGRLGAAGLRPALESFAERYPDRGRSPADDTLDEWEAQA